MTLFRVLVAAALISVTTGTAVFARTPHEQPRYEQSLPSLDRAGGAGGSWCLHNYANDEIDCSFASHSQCAATASGGLGDCSMN